MSVPPYEEILPRTIALIARVCKKDATAESRFIEDLELDSIDLVGLVSEMEDEFGVFVPEDKLRTFQTVAQASRCIHELLREGEQVA